MKLKTTILIAAVAVAANGFAAEVNIPALKFTPRSDWINVKTDVKPAAAGDGMTDDTAAIQEALNIASAKGSQRKTVYLPPGKYRVTQTLAWATKPGGPLEGALLVGAGRDTTLLWDGADGGTMFVSTGAARVRYIGLVWDGRGKAAHAYNHISQHAYETRVRHESQAFLRFTGAAITSGGDGVKAPTAEVLIWNCLFRDCGTGVIVGEKVYNYYQWIFDGCEFENCGVGIGSPCGKFVVLNTRFLNSSIVDVGSGLTPRMRRCISIGSNQFFSSGRSGVAGGIAIQDCIIDSWKSNEAAVMFGNRGPLQIFDCVFVNPPGQGPAVIVDHDFRQNVIESNNTVPEGTPLAKGRPGMTIVSVPAGKRGPALKPDDRRPFLRETAPADGKIFDAKVDFGAKGDGKTDDTAAIRSAVAAAAAEGNGAIVYFPIGIYPVSETILLTGGGYRLQGNGLRAMNFLWTGAADAPVLHVDNPRDISLEQLVVICGEQNPGVLVTATAPGRVTVDGLYYKNPDRYVPPGPGLVLRDLPAGMVVVIPHLDGPLTVDDCARAKVLVKWASQGTLTVKGATKPKTGLIGCVTFQGGMIGNPDYWDVTVADNQDLVIGDYYDEQTYKYLTVSGLPGRKDGRVTIQGIKQHAMEDAKEKPLPVIDVDNYGGQVMYSLSWMNNHNPFTFTQRGNNPCDLIIMGNTFSTTVPEMKVGFYGRLISFHNILNTTKPVEYLPDIIPDGGLDAVARAFDHLRELSALDLELYYGER